MTIVLGIGTGGTYTDAIHHMIPLAEEKARQSGAEHVQVQVTRKEKKARAKGNREIYLETELTFMALGRPGIAASHNMSAHS